MNDFDKRLKTIRIENGMTQAELGEVVGYTQSSIAKLEAGTRQPSVDILIKLAKYFKISVDELLGLDEKES